MRIQTDNSIVLEPVETKRSSEAIFDQIRRKIMAGEILPGERLPSERAMMDMLERSRPTIREALRMLECAGLVEIFPGSGGAVVMRPSDASVAQPLESMLTLKQIDKTELLEYRELNEIVAVGWAAERRTDEEAAAILGCVEQLRYVKNDISRFADQDLAFHQAIARAGHNRLSSIVAGVVHGLVLNLLSEAYEQKSPHDRQEMIESIVEQHAVIAAAIQARDGESAKRKMQEHIGSFEAEIICGGRA